MCQGCFSGAEVVRSFLANPVAKRAAKSVDGDIAAAEKLLLAAERDEAITRLAYLQLEFERLDGMIAQLGDLKTSVSHSIELPQGNIDVYIAIPEKSMWQKVLNWLG